jgi:uncharacterized membrane protein YidH (DUF202 family)
MNIPSPTFWQVLKSVVAAALGVQNRANLERDFSHGKPIHYIMVGLLFTVLFVCVLVGIVMLVMRLALS